MCHPRDANELLEVPRDELWSIVGDVIRGLASGYFSLARSRIISMSASFIAASQPALKYRRVEISGINRNRRGKHYDLVKGIFRELEMLPAGAALEIPLVDVGGIGLCELAFRGSSCNRFKRTADRNPG